ncbi:MAG: hypothetical protein LBL31_06755, partial [Spirochaetaceae bacterium]|nr:hypothetical protein [Spirochaetaceae bacterium]
YKARREADSGLAGQLVRRERAVQPRLGGRKLFPIPGPELAGAGVRTGRDRFFEVLKEQPLLHGRLPGAPRATDSRHSLPVFHNLARDMDLAGPCQARAADIACIRTGEGFLYPSLLMDLWSRKTAGFHAGDTLEAEGAVRVLSPGRGVLSSRRGVPRPPLTGAANTARAGMLKSSRPAGFRQA